MQGRRERKRELTDLLVLQTCQTKARSPDSSRFPTWYRTQHLGHLLQLLQAGSWLRSELTPIRDAGGQEVTKPTILQH